MALTARGEGFRMPHSHRPTAAILTPNLLAKPCWVRPRSFRMLLIFSGFMLLLYIHRI